MVLGGVKNKKFLVLIKIIEKTKINMHFVKMGEKVYYKTNIVLIKKWITVDISNFYLIFFIIILYYIIYILNFCFFPVDNYRKA